MVVVCQAREGQVPGMCSAAMLFGNNMVELKAG